MAAHLSVKITFVIITVTLIEEVITCRLMCEAMLEREVKDNEQM